MEINGIAHIMLTVSNFDACVPFYEQLLQFLGLRPVIKTDGMLYCVGGRTAVGIMQAEDRYRDERFAQLRVGLHHVCFRARERQDIDAIHTFLTGIGATIVHPPEDGPWAPGYYSVLFEDPDGVRLEVNHVPGKGLLGTPPRVDVDVGSACAAAGVWLAVPITGYWIFARPHRGCVLPAVALYAVTAAAGLAVWSVLLLVAAVAGVYSAAVIGLLGWGASVIGLVALWYTSRADGGAPTASLDPTAAPSTGRDQRRHRKGQGQPPRRAKQGEQRATKVAPRAAFGGAAAIWGALLAVGLAVAGVLYLGFPTESIYGGRDEGIYANQAIYIAQHGRLGVPYPFPKDAAAIFADGWAGFPGFYQTPGEMTPQFSQLFPVWLAQAFATVGPDGLFRMNAVFALLSLAVLYGVCLLAVSQPYAVIATLFLAFNPSQLWMARITLSEVLTQLFTWSSLLLLAHALRERRPSLARWAGLFVGCAALVRFDGLILIPLLLISHAAFRILTVDEGDDARVSSVWYALYRSALLASAGAFAYYAFCSAPYFRDVSHFYLTPLIGATIGAAVLVLLTTASPLLRRLRPVLTSHVAVLLLSAGVVGLTAYGYWLRPMASTAPVWKSEPSGYVWDITRDYAQDSLVNLARYLSPAVLTAGVAGWLLVVWALARTRVYPSLAPVLCVIAGCAAIYLWDPAVYPDHYWAIRRFVPVVIPGFVLCAAIAVHEATRRLPVGWAWALGALAVGYLVLFTLGAGHLLFTFAEDKGHFRQLQELAKQLPADEAIVTHGPKEWVTPVYVALDRRVIPLDLNTEGGLKAKEAWVARQARLHLPTYLLVEVAESSRNPTKVAEAELSRSYLQPTTNPLPQKIITKFHRVELYKVEP